MEQKRLERIKSSLIEGDGELVNSPERRGFALDLSGEQQSLKMEFLFDGIPDRDKVLMDFFANAPQVERELVREVENLQNEVDDLLISLLTVLGITTKRMAEIREYPEIVNKSNPIMTIGEGDKNV
jgi:hypothetical protein